MTQFSNIEVAWDNAKFERDALKKVTESRDWTHEEYSRFVFLTTYMNALADKFNAERRRAA